MDNISFMFCHIVISVNISNCHPSPCRLLQKKNVRFLGFQIFCMKTAQKKVRKSARFLQNLVYTQAGSYCPSCSPWNIHGLGCFCNFFGKLQPPKKLEDFKSGTSWKQEETALDSLIVQSHQTVSLNPRRCWGDPSPSSLRKVRWKGSWSTQRGLWVSQMGLFRQWKVGQKLLN